MPELVSEAFPPWKKVTGLRRDLFNNLILFARNVETDGEEGIRMEEAVENIETLFSEVIAGHEEMPPPMGLKAEMTDIKLKTNRRWISTLKKVDQLTDGRGTKVDTRIRETVAILWLYGFHTYGSCEGHLEWGEPYPWVELYAPEPTEKNWRKNDDIYFKWAQQNRQEQLKMLMLLLHFQHRCLFEPLHSGQGRFGSLPCRPEPWQPSHRISLSPSHFGHFFRI